MLGFLQFAAECLELIAFGAQARGRAEDAVLLIGAADTWRERTGMRATLAMAEHRATRLPQLRAELGDERFETTLAQGRALTDEDAFVAADRVAAHTA